MKHCAHCGSEMDKKSWERGVKNHRIFCSPQCKGEAVKATGISRFLARVNRTESIDECWEWKGKWCGRNYPMVTIRALNYNPIPVHRAAFFIHYGKFPENETCHKCNNPPCCNPYHLYDGTTKQNHDDSVKAGTAKFPKGEKGSRHPFAKLTENQVIEIRKVYKTLKPGEKAAYAKQLGMNRNCVNRIATGHTWEHVH